VVKKIFYYCLIGVLIIIVFIILKSTKGNGDKLLKFLDDKKIGFQKEIEVINKRQQVRRISMKIKKEKHVDFQKNIKHMSINDLDKYIKDNG